MVNIGSEPGRSVRKDKNDAGIRASRVARKVAQDARVAGNPKTQSGVGGIKRRG